MEKTLFFGSFFRSRRRAEIYKLFIVGYMGIFRYDDEGHFLEKLSIVNTANYKSTGTSIQALTQATLLGRVACPVDGFDSALVRFIPLGWYLSQKMGDVKWGGSN